MKCYARQDSARAGDGSELTLGNLTNIAKLSLSPKYRGLYFILIEPTNHKLQTHTSLIFCQWGCHINQKIQRLQRFQLYPASSCQFYRMQEHTGEQLRVSLHIQGWDSQQVHHLWLRQRRRLVRHRGGQRGWGGQEQVGGLRGGVPWHWLWVQRRIPVQCWGWMCEWNRCTRTTGTAAKRFVITSKYSTK